MPALVVRRAPRTARSETLTLEAVAREAGLHPALVRRYMGFGLPRPSGGTWGSPQFARDAALRVARAQRLRRDLGLNLAGAVLACELLARVEELEERLRRYEPDDDRSR
jgi:DNA-binding transcriptional MerR regulator